MCVFIQYWYKENRQILKKNQNTWLQLNKKNQVWVIGQIWFIVTYMDFRLNIGSLK